MTELETIVDTFTEGDYYITIIDGLDGLERHSSPRFEFIVTVTNQSGKTDEATYGPGERAKAIAAARFFRSKGLATSLVRRSY